MQGRHDGRDFTLTLQDIVPFPTPVLHSVSWNATLAIALSGTLALLITFRHTRRRFGRGPDRVF